MASNHSVLSLAAASVLVASTWAPSAAWADHGPELDDGSGDGGVHVLDRDGELVRRDPDQPKIEHDAATAGMVISDGPFADVIRNLAPAGRGERLQPNATTDVWAHGRYAYTGTFNNPCGGEEDAGIFIWDIRNPNRVTQAGFIPSPEGSRSNDVKVAEMNSGTILVHSNEPCAGGPGGFEIYNVDDPRDPVHLASVQTDDVNAVLREVFGVVDVGVHNLFLFRQGERDYVSAVTEGFFGNFQVFDITDPTNPQFVTAWGAEELCPLPQCSDDPQNETDIDVILDTIFDWMQEGFGNSRNRFLHDITVSSDGTLAYLSNWDAGLVLLDISVLIDPLVVSVALDPVNGSLDGEVNSHAAWPSEDGRIVVETEEDFDAWVSVQAPGNLTFGEGDPAAPLPGVAISTSTGDAFEAAQTGNAGTLDATSLEVTFGPLAGTIYAAVELSGDQPKLADIGPISDDIVWIGRACDVDPILNESAIAAGGIAIVRRGTCTFREKNFNAAAAGADAIVIANNLSDDTPWGGVRIWDYSDPANPVLASTFDTACSAASEPLPECDLRGTWSVHNVIVETRGDKVFAYFSWYSEGVLVVDVSDPYNPVEVARFHREGPEFEETNGGIQDVWGIYKINNQPWLYASDRNGGLYVLKELGQGTIGRR